MDQHYLQKQLDLLWTKVKGKVDHPDQGDFISAFEQAQAEIQAEAIQNLKSRFDKERIYWENLLASKEEALVRLQLELEEAIRKNQEHKNKIIQLQESEGGWLEQSFATIELQKKSLNSRIEHLEVELENARKDYLNLKFRLEEESEDQRKALELWKEKENHWSQTRDALESDISHLKDQSGQIKEAHFDEILNLNRTVQSVEKSKKDQEDLHQSEKKGLENLLSEKAAQAEKLSEELNSIKLELAADREGHRLASVERERRTVQDEEDRKRIVEQLLTREKKIKELQDSLENLMKEQEAQKELLRRREETIKVQEELLSRRREDWVESVKGQASQQLNLSGKVIDLLNKLEGKTVAGEGFSGNVPALPASYLAQSRSQSSAVQAGFWARWAAYTVGEKLIVVSVGLAILLTIGGGVLFMGSEGRKAATAQKYLMRGNELYTNGALDESLKLLEKAFKLDPENSIIKNSYTLVLGELANRYFLNGQFEDALSKTEILNRIIPEDSDVVKLYNSILQSLGNKNRSKASVIPAIPIDEKREVPSETRGKTESMKSAEETPKPKNNPAPASDDEVHNQEL